LEIIVHNYFEESFSKEKSHQYNLSVLISTDRLSFLISDVDNKVIALRAYQISGLPEELNDIYQQILVRDTTLKQSFNTERIVFSNLFSTLLPFELYQIGSHEQYIKTILPSPEMLLGQSVLTDSVKPLGIQCVYLASTELTQKLSAFFPRASFYHLHSALLSAWTQHERKDKQVLVNVQTSMLTIACFDKDKILYCNSFEYKNVKDFLYYIVLVYESLGLSTEKIPLIFYGEILVESALFKEVYKYIRHVEFGEIIGVLKFGNLFKDLQGHFFAEIHGVQTL
jgi:hypothetical protein